MRNVGPLAGRAFITMGQGCVQRTTNCIGREMIYLNIRAWKGDKKDFNSNESTASAASQSLGILFSARKEFFFYLLSSFLS
jgi:hypothetical protein